MVTNPSSGWPIGTKQAIHGAQSVLGPTVQAATYAFPGGHLLQTASYSFGLIGYFMRRRIKRSFLPDSLPLAIDSSNLYLLWPRFLRGVQELGRWRLGNYGATAGNTGRLMRGLTLQLEGMGQVDLEIPIRLANKPNDHVIDFAVKLANPYFGTSGPPNGS